MALLGNILSGRGVRPEGRDDYYTIGEDDSAELRPTDNDVSNHPLFPYWKEITSVDLGDFLGTVEIIGAEARYNQLRITPGAAYDYLGEGESETVEIGYTFRNAWGTWHEATIHLTIEGANDAPEAQDVTGTVDEDGPTISLAADFTDIDANDTHTITIDDGGTVGLVTNANGSFTYDPNGQFESLAVGETATDSFTYTVDDGNGGVDTATVAVTVTGQNDVPVAQNVAGSVDENGSAITLAANFSDIDTADTHTVGIDTTGTIGSVTDHGDGTFSYDPNGQFEYLAAGETTTDSFTYTVDDGNGGTSTATVTVTITGENDAPAADPVTATVLEDAASVQITALFSDVDLADMHSFTIDTTGTAGSVMNNGDGTFTYSPNGQFESLGRTESTTDTFTYTVDDGNGGTSTNTVTVTVLGQNDAPTLTADSSVFIAENETAVTAYGQSASDADNGAILSYAIAGGADAALFSINSATGGVSFNTAPDFEMPLDDDGDNIYEINIQVNDEHGAVSSAHALSVEVTDVDEGPQPDNLLITFDELSVFETFDNTIYQDFFWTTTGAPLSAEDWDSDGDLEGFSGLTTVAFERIDGADFDLNALELGAGVSAGGAFGQPTSITIRGLNNGTVAHSVTLSAADLFDFQLSMTSIGLNFTGIDRVEIQTTDGFAAIDNVDVDVLPAIPNTAPVFDADDIINTPEKDFSVAAYSSTITDPDLADTHTYQIAGGADAGAFTINANTGALTFKELPDFELPGDANGDGLYEINLTVTDLSGAVSNAEAVIIQVTDVEPEPLVEVPLFVDFEDLALGTTLGTSGGEFYEGFLWSTDSFDLTLQQDLNNGGVEALGQGFVTYEFERADGTDFDFLSAELSSGFDGFDANTIVVVGYDDGVQVFSDTYIRGFDYDPFSPGSIGIGALSVDRIEIQADGLFTMDDMSFEVLV